MEVLNYQENDSSYENKILQLEKEAEEMINTFYFVTDQINQLQNEQQKLKQKVLSIKHQIKSLMKQLVPQSFPNKRKKPMDGFNTDITLFTPNGNMIFTSEHNEDSQSINIGANLSGSNMNSSSHDEKMREDAPKDKNIDNLSSIADKIEISQCKSSNTYLTVLPDINPTQFSIDIKDDLLLQKLDYLLFEKNWRSEPTNSFFVYATSVIETYFKTFFPTISHNTLVLKLQNLREKEISTNNYVQIKDVYLIYHQGLCFSENKINIDNLQFWHEKKLKTSTMIGNVQLWSTTVRSRVEDKSNQLFGFISSRRVAHLPSTPIWLLYYFPKNMWQSSNTKPSASQLNSVSPSNVNNNGNGANGQPSSNGSNNGTNSNHSASNRSSSYSSSSNSSNGTSEHKTKSNSSQVDNSFLKQENSTVNNNTNISSGSSSSSSSSNNNSSTSSNNSIKIKQKMNNNSATSSTGGSSNFIFIKQEGSSGKIPTQVLTPPLNRIMKHKMDVDTPSFLSSDDLRSPYSSASSPVIHPLLPPNNYLEYGNSISMPNLLDYQTSFYNMDFWNWESGVNFDNFGVSSMGQDFAHYAIADNSKSQQLFITFNNSVNKFKDNHDQKQSSSVPDVSAIEKTPQKNFIYKKYHTGDRGGVIAIVGRNEKGKLLYTHNTDDARCSHLTVTSPKYGFMAGSGNEMDGIATADIGIITVGVQINWNENRQKVVLNASCEIEPGKHILVASGLHDFLTVAIPLADLNQKNIKSVVAMPLQSSSQMKADENGVVWVSAFVHSTPSWLLSFLSSSSANHNTEEIAKMIELCCAREMDAKYQNYSNTLEAQLTQLHLSTNQKIEESKLNVENQIKQFTSSLLSSSPSSASPASSSTVSKLAMISDEELDVMKQLIEKNYTIARNEFRTWKNSIDLNLSSISKLKKFEIKQIERIKQKLKKGVEFGHPPSSLLYAEIIILSETDIYQHLTFLSQTFKLYGINSSTLPVLPNTTSPFLHKLHPENDLPPVNSLYDLKQFATISTPLSDDHLRREYTPQKQSQLHTSSNPTSPPSAPDHADLVVTSPSISDDQTVSIMISSSPATSTTTTTTTTTTTSNNNYKERTQSSTDDDEEQNRLKLGKIYSMMGVIEYRVGSYENAVELFTRSSDLQNEESFYFLAEAHYHAIGVTQNIKKAKKLYSKIAYNFEVPQASYALGLIYYFGIGEELPNYLEAEKHLQFVVDHFIPSASTLRDYILLSPSPSELISTSSPSLSSSGSSNSGQKAPAESSSSSNSEEFTSNIIAESAYFLAMIKLQQKDYQGALTCLNLSADLQNSKAQYQLALLYFEGNNFIQQNLEKAKKFLQLSAQQKYLPSIFALSSLSTPSLSF